MCDAQLQLYTRRMVKQKTYGPHTENSWSHSTVACSFWRQRSCAYLLLSCSSRRKAKLNLLMQGFPLLLPQNQAQLKTYYGSWMSKNAGHPQTQGGTRPSDTATRPLLPPCCSTRTLVGKKLETSWRWKRSPSPSLQAQCQRLKMITFPEQHRKNRGSGECQGHRLLLAKLTYPTVDNSQHSQDSYT